MAKHLTAKDIQDIVRLIDSWNGKLGWEALCDAVGPLIGNRPVRQTLIAHEQIKSAFEHQKDRLKSGASISKRPPSLNIAAERIRRLETENNRLVMENQRLLERFMRWQYNAHKFGVSQEKLDAPMPFVDRDSAERKS